MVIFCVTEETGGGEVTSVVFGGAVGVYIVNPGDGVMPVPHVSTPNPATEVQTLFTKI